MNEHNIDNFMKLATNHNRDSDLTDIYYRTKYDEIASGKKFSFNWCAFLFKASWCLYRKMYLYGILLLIFQCLYGEGLHYIVAHTIGIASYDVLPNKIKFILLPLEFAPGILFGFIGNWLYVQQIHKKIDHAYHLSNVKNTDKLTWTFTEVSMMAFGIGIIVFYGHSVLLTGWMKYIPTLLHIFLASSLGFVAVMYDKRKVKAALASRALVAENAPPA